MQYLYDGSFEGFLSVVTVIMRKYPQISDEQKNHWQIERFDRALPLISSEKMPIIPGILSRFESYLGKHFDSEILSTVYHAFLSEMPGIERQIVSYLYLARRLRRDPKDECYIDDVRNVIRAARHTRMEAHRYMGLLRFRKKMGFAQKMPSAIQKCLQLSVSGSLDGLFAVFEPQTNVLPLIIDHFTDRLSSECFAIMDRTRHLGIVHLPNGEPQWVVLDPESDDPADFDPTYEALWREYFKSVSIPERVNPSLQRSNMPLKYRKYLIEDP